MQVTAESHQFDQTVLTPQYLADPYPCYQRLRSAAPVYWSDRLNAWILTRYDDVIAALQHPRLISGERVPSYARGLGAEAIKALEPLYKQVACWIGNLDPPRHTRLRRLVNVVFTPRMVRSLRPQIERITHELLDKVQGAGRMDFISDFAYPLPAIVIAQMLGVPAEDRDRFMAWSDDLTAYAGTGQAQLEVARAASVSAGALTDYFRELAQCRRSQPREDLISSLVKLEDQGDKLTEQELLSMCGFLIVAGHETTMGLLGNGMLALLRHPEQCQKLSSQPNLMASAVEEMLRYDSPIQHQTRVAAEELDLAGTGGCTVSQGQRVLAFLGAANRDPDQFPDPDRFDPARTPNKHLAFGYGIHYCLGAPLARLEAQIAFKIILQRLTDMTLVDPHPPFRVHTSNRNPIALHMTF